MNITVNEVVGFRHFVFYQNLLTLSYRAAIYIYSNGKYIVFADVWL